MKNKHTKHLFVSAVFLLTFFCLFQNAAWAAEKPVVVTGFEELEQSALEFSRKPSQKKLNDQMPDTVTAYEEGTGKQISIPVTWESEEDYEKTNESYYLFYADWDESQYVLSEDYSVEDYRPFMEVSIQSSKGSGTSTYAIAEEENNGIRNIVKRAYQQVQIAWTPLKNLDGYINSKGKLTKTYKKGVTYYGIPYGQLVDSGKYVPHGASFDTFLNSVNTSDSVFYTKRGSYGKKDSTYYGNDCSAFVSYAYGLPRMTTSTIAKSDKFKKVSGNQVKNAQIGDCFNEGGNHVELITNMVYDEEKNLKSIEVSEQTPPLARIVSYTPEKLQEIIDSGYTLLRLKDRDQVEAPDTYKGYDASIPVLIFKSNEVNKTYGDKSFTNALYNPENLSVTYSSSNEKVAVVNEKGKITIKGAGSAVITATSDKTDTYSAYRVSYQLTVAKASQTISINTSLSDILLGETAVVEAEGKGTISYLSDHSDVADVSTEGEVTGVAPGDAVITVKAAGNKNYKSAKKTLDVTVKIPKAKNLKAVSNGYNASKLTWKKIDAVTGYVIYRKIDGSWKSIATVDSSAVSYKDTGLTTGESYTYTIRGYKLVDGSKKKGEYEKKGVTVKIVPSKVKLKEAAADGHDVTVSWEKVAGASKYVVYRKVDGKWVRQSVVDNKTTSYVDKDLKKGTYVYTVRAYRTVSGKNIYGGYDSKGVTAEVK